MVQKILIVVQCSWRRKKGELPLLDKIWPDAALKNTLNHARTHIYFLHIHSVAFVYLVCLVEYSFLFVYVNDFFLHCNCSRNETIFY